MAPLPGKCKLSNLISYIKKKIDMRRERDSRGRFIVRGMRSIPTTPPTPPRLRRDTPPSQAHIPSHRPPKVLRS